MDVNEKVITAEASPEPGPKASSGRKGVRRILAVLCIILIAAAALSAAGVWKKASERTCQVVYVDIPESFPISDLYYISRPLNEEQRERIKGDTSIPTVDSDEAFAVFDMNDGAGEPDSYTFPVTAKGRIITNVFLGFSDGKVVSGTSSSDDMENYLSPLTSEETPMYVVNYSVYTFYVIGDKAYIRRPTTCDMTEVPVPAEEDLTGPVVVLDLGEN